MFPPEKIAFRDGYRRTPNAQSGEEPVEIGGGSADPSTTHNAARDDVWNALLDVLVDAFDVEGVPAAHIRRAIARDEDLADTFTKAWPILDPANVIADLWSSPAYLRLCAPWLGEDDIETLQRADARAWTVADLPLLDAARRRIGDPFSSHKARARDRTLARNRAQMERVVEALIEESD